MKSLWTGHLIMAADAEQSIYGISSPFARGGIQIAGRTRMLRTNFRNTREIAAVADRFAGDSERTAFAFRNGPEPELHVRQDAKELLPLLLAKLRLFTTHLGYEPDNICVLAAHKSELELLSRAIEESGIETTNMVAHEFTFEHSGALRLSTLHSSKGLDFPVVMLYLPYVNRREQYDAETTERLIRNVVHVGLTRAMENLNVFVCPGDDPVLQDLCEALRSRPPAIVSEPDSRSSSGRGAPSGRAKATPR